MATQDQQNNNSIPTSRQSLQSNLPQQTFKIRGMKTDLSESSFENDFAFENMNMRINIVDNDNTLFNLTNERGTVLKTFVSGIPIGVKKYDVDKILLITTVPNGGATKDKFWCISCTGDTLTATMFMYSTGSLVQGDFGLSADNPLEIEHYKDGNKDFFYIADGINNLKSFWVQSTVLYASNTRLEYNSQITGNEKLYVKYTRTTLGQFYSGVIVYCFCYVTKQGHKTNIIDFSDVIPIGDESFSSGLEPNKRANIAFRIGGFNLSSEFDRVEIYSLYRSSLDGEITVRKVQTTKFANGFFTSESLAYPTNSTDLTHYPEGYVNNQFEVQDLNTGEIISYQELLQRFNSSLIPSTLTTKTNSLFVGNIKTNNYSSLKSYLNNNTLHGLSISGTATSNLFKGKNIYFAGIQLQDKYGNWSPVVYAGKIKYGQAITLNSGLVSLLKELGFVAVRAMLLYSKQIHNSICHGFMLPTYAFENGKFGIDYYSQYRIGCNNNDLYADVISCPSSTVYDIFSPDVEFDENFLCDASCYLTYKEISNYLENVKIDITLNSNVGLLYNNTDNSYIGKAEYNSTDKYFIWYDAITKYQESLQLQFAGVKDKAVPDGESNNRQSLVPLYYINNIGIEEKPTKYKIYIWQPSGSLNDSNGNTSVLNTKKISYVNRCNELSFISIESNTDWAETSGKLAIFDGTTNVLPINNKVYSGILNFKYYNKVWRVEKRDNLTDNGNQYVDDNQYIYKNYVRSFMDAESFVGQPIEFMWFGETSATSFKWSIETLSWMKAYYEKYGNYALTNWTDTNPTFYVWGGEQNTSMVKQNYSDFGGSYTPFNDYESKFNKAGKVVPVLVTCNHNRNGVINIGYKTTKHLVTDYTISTNSTAHVYETLLFKTEDYTIQSEDIKNGQWIKSSINYKLDSSAITINFRLDDVYLFDYYNCLKTEAYSPYDTNQIFHLFQMKSVYSYINPMCNYSKYQKFSVASNIQDATDLSSSIMNKLNLVYNQKNNFFIFSGITSDTVTDDTLENTILYSDTKVANEKEDTFVNFPITNFFTIDSNINTINKLITYNDKILCFSNDAIVQILYNENVVINTDSVKSLGLASTDKVTGSQLITNTYGCLNKWSIGIYNNALYFNDDLNKKMMVYNGEFVPLNETLGIETLNSKFFKNVVWNPNSFGNTKLNIDKYAKDVHYTTNDIDIAFNTTIGNFTSLYSYNNIPFVETIGAHSLVFEKKSNSTYLYFLREGKYNEFFGTNKSFWTTVIVNQNSLVNKTISFVDFVTEAYSKDNNNKYVVPQHNYTFDKISFWNDYQNSSSMSEMKINYKMYGQSLLKRKFRIWRINRFRSYQRLSNRNYDTMSNPWHYLKLSVNPDVSNNNYIDDYKLTMHWLNVNYR